MMVTEDPNQAPQMRAPTDASAATAALFDEVIVCAKDRQPGEPTMKDFIEQGKGADEIIETPASGDGVFREKAALLSRIRNDFGYHKADADGIKKMNKIREACYLLAQILVEAVPSGGTELERALVHLEEVMFNANAGISRRYKEYTLESQLEASVLGAALKS